MAREERNGGGMYFLLDSNNQTVARGMLRGPEEDMALQIKVLDDKISDVMRHEQIRLVSLKGNTPAMVTKVTAAATTWWCWKSSTPTSARTCGSPPSSGASFTPWTVPGGAEGISGPTTSAAAAWRSSTRGSSKTMSTWSW